MGHKFENKSTQTGPKSRNTNRDNRDSNGEKKNASNKQNGDLVIGVLA